MNFEKWQALGNDYIILEESALPFELSSGRIQRICAPHFGVGADGILLLSRLDGPGPIARMRIFNPDGSEAGLSGNGAREAVMYMRARGWTGVDEFSIQTLAGEIRAWIKSASTCKIDMGHARLRSEDYPDGAQDGVGELIAGGRSWQFQHVNVGNPQCAIHVDSEAELMSLDLPSIGPDIERNQIFPNRTNVSWFTSTGPGQVRARIFERGVGETSASGTGATGAAVASTLRGGSSPVTVILDGGELEVGVGQDLSINLSGWAVPVMSGALSDELMEELRATE